MGEWIIIMIAIALLSASVFLNVFLILYIRNNIVKVFVISEESAEIFTRLDSFGEHLKTIYEMPVFYGDETLGGLLEHLNTLNEFLTKYEGLHSFTQPDLVEQLESASLELQKKYEQKEAQEKE
tara:strand:+ start:1382 stop:1753 length:372 start_codon:yes stop_codon:yes gene_type:complete